MYTSNTQLFEIHKRRSTQMAVFGTQDKMYLNVITCDEHRRTCDACFTNYQAMLATYSKSLLRPLQMKPNYLLLVEEEK